MSITTQIERINTAKAEIKEVVNQDFEKIQDETLTYYPEKIAEVIEEYKKYIPEKKVSGTEINISDAAPLAGKLAVKGNTEQKSLTGKNLLDYTNIYEGAQQGIKTTLANNELSFKGTTTASYANILQSIAKELEAKTYTLSINKALNYDVRLRIYYDGGTYTNHSIPKGSTSVTFTTTNVGIKHYIYLANFSAGLAIDDTITIQLEEGSTATDFEEYCGGQASPNPDYPQEIKVVTGNNIIKHVGQNLFDISDISTITSDKVTIDKDGWITASYNNQGSSAVYCNIFTQASQLLKTNKEYALIMEVKSIEGTGILYSATKTSGVSTSQCRDNITYSFSDLASNHNYKNTFTTISDFSDVLHMIRTVVRFNAGQSGSITFRLSVLENTDVNVETFKYESYKYEKFKLDLSGNNKYDQTKAIDNAAYRTTTGVLYGNGSCWAYNAYLRKYSDKITFSSPDSSTATYRVMLYDEDKNFISSIAGSSLPQTFDISSASYYTFYFDKTTFSIENRLMVNEGSTAEGYTEYNPIELCEIDNYQDTIFKNVVGDENYNAELEVGAWYEKNCIEKDVLDGTDENITIDTKSTNTTRVYFRTTQQNASKSFFEVTQLSNCLSFGAINNLDQEGFYAGTNKTTVVRMRKSLIGTDAESVNNYLAHNNITFYFVMSQPTYTKITDTTLISQLEALRKAKWFKGVNHWWTETENLEPVLEGTYKQALSGSEVP